MQKYFCNPCGYTYDPEKATPSMALLPAQHSRIFLLTGVALYAA